MRQGFFDKFVSRLDRLDAPVVSAHLLKLARERGFLEMLFQSIDEGILVIGEGGTLLYANRAAERMVGFEADVIRGQSIARHLREWGIEGMLLSQMSDWSRVEMREVEVTYPEHRFISFYARPIESEGNTELLLILHDVTHERQAEESALADERLTAVKTLAAGVAHEIGNPLNALTIHLQLLTRELRTVQDAAKRASLEELTTVATQEVARLDGILHRFLEAIRPSKPKLCRGNVVDVLRTTLKLLAPDMEQRLIDLQLSIPESVPEIFQDGAQLEQVFFNLLKNAMDAIPDRGRIGVTVTFDDAWVNASVFDNGSGIPSDLLGHIFDPYVTTKTKGNGLGLMVVRRIVQGHGGSIECASHQGEGTCFIVRLPRAERCIRAIPPSPLQENAT
ncbi:MAG: ATP-binding protein [Kiritimatiellia bacterium]